MQRSAFVAALSVTAFLGLIGAAKADLMITPNGGEQDVINDAGGTTGTGDPNNQPSQGNGLPLGLTGYNSQNPGLLSNPQGNVKGPSLIAVAPGTYKFTYMGKGDAADHDTFTVGAHTFDNTINAPGDSFFLDFGANTEIAFIYNNLTTGKSISDDADPVTADLSYFLGLDSSSHCKNTTDPNVTCDGLGDALTGPSFPFAYIGLADLPWTQTADHDFQDLGVRVDEVPEPASLGLFGSAMVGLLAFRRRRKDA